MSNATHQIQFGMLTANRERQRRKAMRRRRVARFFITLLAGFAFLVLVLWRTDSQLWVLFGK